MNITPKKIKEVLKKYKASYYWEDIDIIECSNSEELKAICKELKINYDKNYCVIDTPISHQILIYAIKE